MQRDYPQITWNEELIADARQLISLAREEDLHGNADVTTAATVPPSVKAHVAVNARQPGIAVAMQLPPLIIDEFGIEAAWTPKLADGEQFSPGQTLGELKGSAAGILTAERTILNFLGRLCGIATLAGRYVTAVGGLPVGVYDTRKTTPGWRTLEKYAVACGGAKNHRLSLDSAILIKDNHLALAGREGGAAWEPAKAVEAAREYIARDALGEMVIEIEVDSLQQLRSALTAGPDIVLLDNMSNDTLREAVAMRNEQNSSVELEASGGVNLETIRGIGETGVDRISVGAMTHGAVSLDIGLDWLA